MTCFACVWSFDRNKMSVAWKLLPPLGSLWSASKSDFVCMSSGKIYDWPTRVCVQYLFLILVLYPKRKPSERRREKCDSTMTNVVFNVKRVQVLYLRHRKGRAAQLKEGLGRTGRRFVDSSDMPNVVLCWGFISSKTSSTSCNTTLYKTLCILPEIIFSS